MRIYRALLAAMAVCLILTGCNPAPVATVGRPNGMVGHLTFYSQALHARMAVDVYLPPGYNPHAKISYPVLYLLPGKDANQNTWMTTTQWFNSIHIDSDATHLISAKKILPMIIVSPNIGNSYGVNSAAKTYNFDGYSRGQYETYIDHDLVHFIDHRFHVVDKPSARYIGGYAMGGFAALQIAFTHQNEYAKVATLDAALWTGALPQSLAWLYPTKADKAARDPIALAQSRAVHIPVFLVAAQQGAFYAANQQLYVALKQHLADVTFHPYSGAPDYAFWRAHANELLEFFDASPQAQLSAMRSPAANSAAHDARASD